MQKGQHYRARKAIEWKYTRGWTHKRIAEELDVRPETVSQYINDPPEELKEPIKHFKEELVMGTYGRLQEQLQEANRRARNAEEPSKVFEFDEDGNLKTETIHLDDGGTETVPKVQGMEMQPNEKERYFARQEERQIISMLWDLAGAREPEQLDVDHSGLDQINSTFVANESDDTEE